MTAEQRRSLLDAAEAAIWEADDEEFLNELRHDGVDVKGQSLLFQTAARAGIGRFYRNYKEQLRRQLAMQEPSIDRLSKWQKRPIAEVRAVYERARQLHSSQSKLSIAFRQRTAGELTDEEILSQVAHLDALGELPEE